MTSSQIPLPSKLSLHNDIINLVIAGDLDGVKKKLQQNNIKEIVHIRGANYFYEDLNWDEEDEVETNMWNPLHFAVYHQHVHIVKYFINTLKVNVSVTAPKAKAESEKDPTNSVNFKEDKILLLMLAFTKRNGEVLSFLLNELWYFWTSSIIEHLINQKFFESIQEEEIKFTGQKPWTEVIPIVLRSETIHVYFKNLSYKKRKAWLSEFIMDATTSNTDSSIPEHKQVAQTFRLELTRQPYAGVYLFHLLFEEFADNREIVMKAYENATTLDYIVHISMMEDSQVEDGLAAYFDINRMMKLSDKFADESVVAVLE